LLETCPDPMWVKDLEGRYLAVNPAYLQVNGWELEQVIGRTDWELFPAEEAARSNREDAIALKQGLLEAEISESIRGKRYHFLTKKVPLRAPSGQVVGTLGISRDIFDRKQAEDALRQSEARCQALLQDSTDIIAIISPRGLFRYVTPAMERVLGYEAKDIEGVDGMAFIHADDQSQVRSRLAGVVVGGVSLGYPLQFRFRHADGSWVWLETVVRRIEGIPGLEGLILNARDISERKKGEQTLQAFTDRLHTLMDNLPGLAYRRANDRQWTMEYLSEGVATLTGYPAEEFLGNRVRSFASLIEETDRDRVWETVQAALQDRQPYVMEYCIRTASGEGKWVWERGTEVYGEKDELVALEGFITDISERKRAEVAARESEAKVRTILEQFAEGFVLVDDGGRIAEWNQAMTQLSGVTREKVLGSFAWDILYRFAPPERLTPDLHQCFQMAVQEALRTGESSQFYRHSEEIMQRPDGQQRTISDISFPIRFEKSIRIGHIVQDISEQARLQQELALRAQMLDSATETIIVHDLEGHLHYANEAAWNLHGYTHEEFLALNLAGLNTPASAARIEERLPELERKGSLVIEVQHLTRDGKMLPLEIHARLVKVGSRKLVLSVGRDIRERQKAEQLQADMIRAVVHDLSNPIACIQAAIEMVPIKVHKPPPLICEYLDIIARNIERLADLSRHLLESARLLAGTLALKRERIDLTQLLRDISLAQRPLFQSKGLEDCWTLPEGPVWAWADRSRLDEAFTNLVGNAIKFTSSGGSVTVQLAVKAGEAVITVQDTGPGIEPQDLPHIFDRFVHGQGAATGAGLGLFIASWIVRAHGGTIEVSSEPGMGTTFTVRLPLEQGCHPEETGHTGLTNLFSLNPP
jgi:PAS domain S-box-containing protein